MCWQTFHNRSERLIDVWFSVSYVQQKQNFLLFLQSVSFICLYSIPNITVTEAKPLKTTRVFCLSTVSYMVFKYLSYWYSISWIFNQVYEMIQHPMVTSWSVIVCLWSQLGVYSYMASWISQRSLDKEYLFCKNNHVFSISRKMDLRVDSSLRLCIR